MNSEIGRKNANWSREYKRTSEWSPDKSLLRSILDYQRQYCQRGVVSTALKRWAVFSHRFVSDLSGAHIPLNCQIEGGLFQPDPYGVVISTAARIGPNWPIFQQVTLGTLGGTSSPVLASQVNLGAGAKLLVPIHVREHAQIGANKVVLVSVPPCPLTVAVPADLRELALD